MLFSEIDDESDITFYQWISTDRTDLMKLTEDKNDFCDRVQRYIPKIALRCYINRKQHQFIESLNARLATEKSVIANVDFGQNYTFLIQDSVQSYYWNPPQATIHSTIHNAANFYCFHHEVIVEMKKLVKDLEKVYLISDGSPAQYKSFKSFCNLLHHQKDFDVKCERHFHATAHGKSSCDAASGICKNNARQGSKRGRKITNPQEFYEFCEAKLSSDKMKFLFVS